MVADLQGPGVIYRIWTPTPTDDCVRVLLRRRRRRRASRSSSARCSRVRSRRSSRRWSGYGAGGFYCYVPLPYEKSCKIVARAERVQFYQINYARYPQDAPIADLVAGAPGDRRAARQQRGGAVCRGGPGPQSAGGAAGCHVRRCTRSGVPRSRSDRHAVRRRRRAAASWACGSRRPSALAGKPRRDLLRITWDGANKPAVLCPAGRLLRLRLGTTGHAIAPGRHGPTTSNYCYFPMPFDKSAKIELVSERTAGPPVELRAEVVTAAVPRQCGRRPVLRRVAARESDDQGPAVHVRRERQGRGIWSAASCRLKGMMSGETPFFEGDDETTIDGETDDSRHRLGGLLQRRLVRRARSLGEDARRFR